LAPELLVKRGSQVILRAGAGMFEVNVVGKALSDAAEGERVRVKNVKSQRIVEGYVMADGSVQVPM
jgi:flagella basal body P-ring formation protein FlgA